MRSNSAVNPVKGEHEPPRPEPLQHQARDKILGEPPGGERQIGGVGDRLGKAQPYPPGRGFGQWRQRLRQIAICLVETPRRRFTKAARHRVARHRIKIADPLQPDPPQPLRRRRVETQCLNRQRGETGAGFSRPYNDRALAGLRKASECPGGAECVGDGNATGDALAVEPGDQISRQGILPAPKMGAAGNLDFYPVDPVGGCPRTIAIAPFRQPQQGRGVLCRLGRDGRETGQKGQRIGQRHSRGETGGRRCRVDRIKQAPPGAVDDRSKGQLLSRRGGLLPAGMYRRRPAPSVDRPVLQPEIQYLSHRPFFLP